MGEVGENCQELESLDVDILFFNISQDTLHCTLKNFKMLKRLNLGFLGVRVNDSTLELIGAHNKELEQLDLTDCQQISDSAIQRLAQSLPGLKSLNLSWCT